jgi:hypothetical protein
MALPISATPVLKGEEAQKFYADMETDAQKGVSKEEVLRGIKIFDAVMQKNPDIASKFGKW